MARAQAAGHGVELIALRDGSGEPISTGSPPADIRASWLLERLCSSDDVEREVRITQREHTHRPRHRQLHRSRVRNRHPRQEVQRRRIRRLRSTREQRRKPLRTRIDHRHVQQRSLSTLRHPTTPRNRHLNNPTSTQPTSRLRHPINRHTNTTRIQQPHRRHRTHIRARRNVPDDVEREVRITQREHTHRPRHRQLRLDPPIGAG